MDIKQTKIVRSVFTIKRKFHVTPHFIRIVFDMSDEQSTLFSNVTIGSNNKIFIPLNKTAVLDLNDEQIWNSEEFFTRRTYTTRAINFKEKELVIDFVAHGDNGPASAWAATAVAGDILCIAMKENTKPLIPEADQYLLVGDHTALPVISVILEQLPKDVKVQAFIEVYGKEDEIYLNTSADVKLQWLHNPNPEKGSKLAEAVANTQLPDANKKRFSFVAGEYLTVKDLRTFFKENQNWSSNEYSATSYWKSGTSEDESSSLRRLERNS